MSDDPLWPAGTATGIGSVPGVDVAAATRAAFDDWPALPFLPELPQRGPGADLVGRTAGLLVDLYVDLVPSGWRLVPRPGMDWRRTADLRARDLDAALETAEGYAGPLKVQVAGPWTLAASLELATGHRALVDPGAVRDLTASLAEGVAAYVAGVRARIPGAEVLLQVDEPSLPAVLAGTIPTVSGYGRLDPVEEPLAEERLAAVVAVAGVPVVVHCCAPGVPVALLRRAGARAVALDVSLLPTAAYDALGEAMDGGLGLLAGAVPTDRDPTPSSVDAAAERLRRLASALGIPATEASRRVAVSPACGLAGLSVDRADAVGRAARAVARQLHDTPD